MENYPQLGVKSHPNLKILEHCPHPQHTQTSDSRHPPCDHVKNLVLWVRKLQTTTAMAQARLQKMSVRATTCSLRKLPSSMPYTGRSYPDRSADIGRTVMLTSVMLVASVIIRHRSHFTDHTSSITSHRSPVTDHRSPVTDTKQFCQ